MSRSFDILHSENARAATPGPAAVPFPSSHQAAAPPDEQAGVAKEIVNLVQRVFHLHRAVPGPKVVAFSGIDDGAGCGLGCALGRQKLWRCRDRDEFASSTQISGRHLCTNNCAWKTMRGFPTGMKQSRPLAELARPARIARLWAITAGAAIQETSASLSQSKLRSQFAQLRQEFDHVLIDTPAMSLHADAELLGQVADGMVLVIGATTTRREPARIAKESLMAAGIPVLGAVLNRRTYPIPEALYRRL